MTLDNILDNPPDTLQPVHGRELMTVSYLLKYHGYTFLSEQVKELADQIFKDAK